MTIRVKLLILSMLVLLLSACGSGMSGNDSSGSAVAKSESCLASQCHASTYSKVTGVNLADEWKMSIHYKMNVAGCADCHDASHNSGNMCNDCHGSKVAVASGSPEKCGKCHGLDHPEDRMVSLAPQHFPIISTGKNRYTNKARASYLSSQYGKCSQCHNPHDSSTSLAYFRSWADSSMANTRSGRRTKCDFKMLGTEWPANLVFQEQSEDLSSSLGNSNILNGREYKPNCVRCHTTTGFKNLVESTGFLKISPFGANSLDGPYLDNTKEVTNCDACHVDYSYKLRLVKPVTIYYNFSSNTRGRSAKVQDNPVVFPDLGYSNMCVPCHSGWAVGSIINKLAAVGLNFSSATTPSLHYYPVSIMLTGKGGYEFAGKNYATGTVVLSHQNDFIASNGTTPKGPCIGCHVNSLVPSDSHLFVPIVRDTVKFTVFTGNTLSSATMLSEIRATSCGIMGCHIGGTKTMTVTNMNTYKQGYIAALVALSNWVTLVRSVPVNSSLAWNYTTNPLRTSTNYTYNSWGTGMDTMGAVFNESLLKKDPGAYTHRPLYAKRLIYDTITYLMQEKGQTNVADAIEWLVLNDTIKTTVNNTTKTATFTAARLPQGVADAAISWLYGKSRTSLTAADKLKRPGD